MQSSGIWTNSKPRPEKTLLPSFESQAVIAVLYSTDEERRAVVTKDAGGLFRVLTEIWHIGDSLDDRWRFMSSWMLRESSLVSSEFEAMKIACAQISDEENA